MRFLSNMIFALFIAAIALSSRAFASQNELTDQFARMSQWADFLCRRYNGCKNVVAGYDIDNTLLEPASDPTTKEIQEVGSDEWFTWQQNLLPAFADASLKPEERAARARDLSAAATDMGGLLNVFSQLLNIFHTQRVDANAANVVARLQNMGIKSVVVTARSPDLRPQTERELQRNGYDFSRLPPGSEAGIQSPFTPYDPAKPEDVGLRPEDFTKLKLSQTPRAISYSKGILMVSGQHKGAMLRTLLARTGTRPKALLYIDDTPMQVENMQAAFEGLNGDDGKPIEVITLQFTKTYTRVLKFLQSDKAEAAQTLTALKQQGKIR